MLNETRNKNDRNERHEYALPCPDVVLVASVYFAGVLGKYLGNGFHLKEESFGFLITRNLTSIILHFIVRITEIH